MTRCLLAIPGDGPIITGQEPDDDELPSLIRWKPGLRQIVYEGPAMPEFLIGPGNTICPPWNSAWQRYAIWGLFCPTAFSRIRSPEEMDATRIKAARTVEVKHMPLTPENIGDADGVYIPPRLFHRYPWPESLKRIVSLPPDAVDKETKASDQNLILLDLFGFGMQGALEQIERVCTEHRIEHLAASPFGYADEGAELDLWAERDAEYPRRLTFFMELAGDFVGLSG